MMTMDKTIDVHGMTVDTARREIERFIAKCDESVKRVIIIHGFQHGDALRRMIQSPNGIRSNRIRNKRFTKNRGETVFELY